MDESLQELENELKRLSPRELTVSLTSRLERELDSVPPPRRYTTATSLRSWKWAAWSLAGAAAVVIGFFGVSFSRPPATALEPLSTPDVASSSSAAPLTNRYEPVRASSVMYDMEDDGLVLLPDNTQGRQVRYRYVDTYTWKNPATKASLKWNVPRDELRLVRTSLD